MNRYLSPRRWFLGLTANWLHVFTGCVLVWIASNGVEATAQTCPWRPVAYAFAGVGISWKTAIIQAAVHATYGAVKYLHHSLPGDTPRHADGNEAMD